MRTIIVLIILNFSCVGAQSKSIIELVGKPDLEKDHYIVDLPELEFKLKIEMRNDVLEKKEIMSENVKCKIDYCGENILVIPENGDFIDIYDSHLNKIKTLIPEFGKISHLESNDDFCSLKDGEKKFILNNNCDEVYSYDFNFDTHNIALNDSPDKYLLSFESEVSTPFKVIDFLAGKLVFDYDGAWSQGEVGGNNVFIRDGNEIRVFDLVTGEEKQGLVLPYRNCIFRIEASNDGKYIAVNSDLKSGSLKIYDTNFNLLLDSKDTDLCGTPLRFSNDSRYLLTECGRACYCIDMQNKKLIWKEKFKSSTGRIEAFNDNFIHFSRGYLDATLVFLDSYNFKQKLDFKNEICFINGCLYYLNFDQALYLYKVDLSTNID